MSRGSATRHSRMTSTALGTCCPVEFPGGVSTSPPKRRCTQYAALAEYPPCAARLVGPRLHAIREGGTLIGSGGLPGVRSRTFVAWVRRSGPDGSLQRLRRMIVNGDPFTRVRSPAPGPRLPSAVWYRVRTRFVQKCTLSARAEAARADEVIERLPGHPGDLWRSRSSRPRA